MEERQEEAGGQEGTILNICGGESRSVWRTEGLWVGSFWLFLSLYSHVLVGIVSLR